MKPNMIWHFHPSMRLLLAASIPCAIALSLVCVNGFAVAMAEEPTKITFEDHIKPIFREHCTSCHNNNAKKGGLSLESFQMTMTGGSSGEVLVAGDLDSSRLYALTAHKEQPVMPPMQDRIPQAKLDLIKTWIEQGMPENSGSAIRKASSNASALMVAATGRPEGPPPMPVSILRQTPLYTPKASAVSALAASPWSPLVAVGGQMQVSLYHSHTGQLMGVIPFPEGEPQSITFSRDGRLILIGGGRHSANGVAVLHEIETGNRIAKVGDELDIVLAADISDDNRWIAVAGPQKMVRVYNTLTGELKWEQKKHTDWIYSLRFSPDGLLLATADRAAGLIIWETATGRLYADLQGHKNEIRGLAWRPDSSAVVTASLDGTLKLWDMNESKLIKSWDAHGGGAAAIAVCNDGTMVSTGRDQKVKVWDSAGNAAGEMPALAEAGLEVAITVDGAHVAAGDWAGNVRLWTRANPADEKRLSSNPPTLDMAIGSGKQRHAELTTVAQAAAKELGDHKTKVVSLQKQIAESQQLIASLDPQIQAATTAANELKTAADQLEATKKTKQAELAAVDQGVQAKQAMQNQLAAEKKTLDDASAALQAQKANATDPASLDQQIADSNKAIQDKANALAQVTAELNAMVADKAQREKDINELTTVQNAKTQEYNGVMGKIAEWNTTKTAAATQVEAWTKEMAAAMEPMAASQAKADAANASVAAAATWVQVLEADIARFQSMRGEFANKKTAIDQAVAQSQTEKQTAETAFAAMQPDMDAVKATMATLEMQIAELQKQMVQAQEKKQGIDNQRSANQKLIDAAAEKLQKLQSDLDNLATQQQLFDASFKTP
jgi:WD40 repeat protein